MRAGASAPGRGTRLRLGRTLEAGSVRVDGWYPGGQRGPKGGVEDSGFGRERGLPGLFNYLRIKNLAIRL